MAYASLARTLAMDLPSVGTLLEATPYMTLVQRKCLVTLTRCQKLPEPGTLTRLRLRKDLDSFVYSPSQGRWVSLLSLVLPVSGFESPLYSGFISMMVRCAPLLNEEDAKTAIRDGIAKEMVAAVEIFHPCTLNWGAVFHTNPYSRSAIPLAPGYPIDTPLLDQIHYALGMLTLNPVCNV